ncbi:class I SAM-dependent methyltransferase [Streptomyces sp. NBC_01262]|uniref:class I SAM-dependent methyltransferase n=1 Tax=Streptomyces sp. NBC_01262 TaxID=2903803 RepID=UPI002E3361AE|nr:methyltransferase domain-containing protein [Streptomyces sp. NBC_01262]
MRTVANTHQAEAWNGYEGLHWAENRRRYDAVNGGMNKPLFEAAAIAAPDHVLDIGCGTGQTTRLAARHAADGLAVGVDLSAPMLEQARTATAEQGIRNARFVQGDAQVHDFAADGFDVAISRGGIMYFADPVAAFTNVGRALRPGGRLAFVCPTALRPDDDFARALTPLWTLMRQHAPGSDTLGESAPGTNQLDDPHGIGQVLDRAGFTDVSTEPISVPMVFGRDAVEAAEFIFAMGPMRFNLQGAAPDSVARARAQVATALADFYDAGEVKLHAALWAVSALRSAPAA